jgi:hypothetical protein
MGYQPTIGDAYDNDSGLAGNRDYFGMLGVTWDDAREAVKAEARLLAAHQGDLAAASAAHDTAVDDDGQGDPVLAGLDVGVAGATFALSAAGFLTMSSCNGAAGHYEAEPVIALVADDARLQVLDRLAAEAGVETAVQEWITVLSGEVHAFARLASSVIAAAPELGVLERPRGPDDDGPESRVYPSWD